MSIPVRSVMHKITAVSEDMTVAEVAKVMVSAATVPRGEIGSVLVVDAETLKAGPVHELPLSKVKGIMTERDVLRLVAKGTDPTRIKAHEVMSSPVITISAGEPVDNASFLMARHGIRRLPVVKDDKVIGIVTARDVANSLRWFILPRR